MTPRWGVWFHAVRPPEELAKLAAAAEALGATAILVADEGTDRDLFVTLAALAQRTRRILLFGAVTNPHSRHPVAIAAAFAALAELAPARVVAGLGAGGSRVFDPMGLAPRRPFTALVECVDVVQALWRGETVDHTGEFDVRGARLDWTPGPLPLAVAGRGPRVERFAAERADWILLAGRAVTDVPELVARLRGTAGRAHPAAIAWNPVAAWTDAMGDELRKHLAYMAADMPECDRAALGLDASRISDAVLDRYAVVGSRAEVASRLAALRQTIEPELMVFDMHAYSTAFLEDLASLTLDSGLAFVHN